MKNRWVIATVKGKTITKVTGNKKAVKKLNKLRGKHKVALFIIDKGIV